MSKCGECYYEGKELNPCNNCFNGDKANVVWTNADRIRAMSDEELAEFLSVRCNIGIEFVKCWLRSEVEEN